MINVRTKIFNFINLCIIIANIAFTISFLYNRKIKKLASKFHCLVLVLFDFLTDSINSYMIRFI